MQAVASPLSQQHARAIGDLPADMGSEFKLGQTITITVDSGAEVNILANDTYQFSKLNIENLCARTKRSKKSNLCQRYTAATVEIKEKNLPSTMAFFS